MIPIPLLTSSSVFLFLFSYISTVVRVKKRASTGSEWGRNLLYPDRSCLCVCRRFCSPGLNRLLDFRLIERNVKRDWLKNLILFERSENGGGRKTGVNLIVLMEEIWIRGVWDVPRRVDGRCPISLRSSLETHSSGLSTTSLNLYLLVEVIDLTQRLWLGSKCTPKGLQRISRRRDLGPNPLLLGVVPVKTKHRSWDCDVRWYSIP